MESKKTTKKKTTTITQKEQEPKTSTPKTIKKKIALVKEKINENVSETKSLEKRIKTRVFFNTILAFSALLIGLIALYFSFGWGFKGTSYTIYIGSTDKDAGYVVHTQREFVEGIGRVFEEEKEGYTLYTADGGYQNGEVYEHSPSYVVYTGAISKQKLRSIIEKLTIELNDTAIFVHRSPSISHYTSFD